MWGDPALKPPGTDLWACPQNGWAFSGYHSPLKGDTDMKLLVFLVLTLAGMGAGLVIGFSTTPAYYVHKHLVLNTAGGALAGAALAAVVVYFSIPAPPRRRDD